MRNSSAPRPNVNLLALPKLALAGRAVLTFRNLAAGTHMTVRIKQLRDKQDRKKKLPVYYVYISLLNDGRQREIFAATLFSDTMTISLNRSVSADSRLGKAAAWLLKAIQNPTALKGKVGLFHEGRCCSCGLPLTHPESIHTALGPVCLERMLKSAAEEGFNLQETFAPVE